MYGLRVITGPTAEPVTLAEVRAQMRVDHSYEDGDIATRILAARQHLERVTGRAFLTQTFELTLDDFPAGAIELPRAPVASITSISYVDTAGQTQTVASYILDGNSLPPRVAPAYGQTWPQTRGTPGGVAIRFVAGSSSVPQDLCLALKMLAAHWNENRETAEDNPAVDALIAPYRVHY